MFLMKSDDEKTEISLGYLLDEQGNETGIVALEIVSPVYGVYSSAYTNLMDQMQDARHKVFGYKEVVDLLHVPLEVGIKMAPADNVNVFTIYEKSSHRNRYVFVGVPKPEFSRKQLTWNGQPLLEAGP